MSAEAVEVTIIERDPGPPYQGWAREKHLDDAAVRRLFERKFGYLPEEVLWDAIVKAGPILNVQPIGGGGG